MKTQSPSRFTPDRLPPDELEHLFVQREDLFSEVLQRIRNCVLTSTGRKILLVGSTGIGKTHFLALLCQRLQKADDLQLLISRPGDESRDVTSLPEFLRLVLRSLSIEVDGLQRMNPDRVEKAAFASLREQAKERSLLLCLENLGDLFSRFGFEGQRRLRAFLDANPAISLLATSPDNFEGLARPGAPFAGYFEVCRLEEISLDAAARLASRMASLDGDGKLAEFVQTPLGMARLEAIRHLAGGNPRAYVTLSPLLSRRTLEDLIDPLMRILEGATFHYQERIAALAPSQRRLIDHLCETDHSVSDAELARAIPNAEALVAETEKLCRLDYIQIIRIGGEVFYRLGDPLLRVGHECRMSQGKSPHHLVRFLRSWHTAAGLQADMTLPEMKVIEMELSPPTLPHANGEVVVSDPLDCESWQEHAWAGLRQGYLEQALDSIDRAIEIGGGSAAWACRALILLKSGRLLECLESCATVTQAHGDDALSWLVRGIAFSQLGCLERSAAALTRLAVLRPDSQSAAALLSAALMGCKRHQEALAPAVRAIELNPENPAPWVVKGLALTRLGRDPDALASFEQALSLGLRTPAVLFRRAQFLFVLDRWREGAESLEAALVQYSRSAEPNAGDTAAILRDLIATFYDANVLRLCIKMLVHIYGKYKLLAPLACGLLECIPDITSPPCIDVAAQAWLRSWKSVAGRLPEFRFSLRLLESAVRYCRKSDARVLKELPKEQQKILQMLVNLDREDGRLSPDSNGDTVALMSHSHKRAQP